MQALSYFDRYLSDYTQYKAYWNYEDGCVLLGCQQLYEATGEDRYRQFILRYLPRFVDADGTISNYLVDQYNTDDINASKALFFAYAQTGDERYRKALDFTRARLDRHPRCACGSFWHKTVYPNQIWLDGLYMVQPFYMAYDTAYGGMQHYRDILRQFENVRAFLFDAERQLAYHGYDESRTQPWADPATGRSANFWLRSLGWYAMALIDTIDACDEQIYEVYALLRRDFAEIIRGLLRHRDAASGLFYQVVDHPGTPGNYLETSGSAMVAYSILKGVRLGLLAEDRYLPIGLGIVRSLLRDKLTTAGGQTRLEGICAVAGLGPGDARDGSIAYYLSEPIVADDAKGVGPFMMAYAEYLRAGGARANGTEVPQ